MAFAEPSCGEVRFDKDECFGRAQPVGHNPRSASAALVRQQLYVTLSAWLVISTSRRSESLARMVHQQVVLGFEEGAIRLEAGDQLIDRLPLRHQTW